MSWRLECGLCGRPVARGLATVCPDCGKPLLARYDLGALDGEALRRAWARRQGGMWRFREIMPVEPNEDPVTLGEGGTPLLEIEIGGEFEGLTLLVKDEGLNPTGSFKDRGLCAAVTRAVHEGATDLVIPSAGNAGAALAAYAARAGVPCRLFIPEDTPEGVARRCEHYGADITRVNGLIDECGRLSAEYGAETGAFNISTLKEPYRIEGKKTMMLEIVEALGWRAPDAIVYPTGGGTGLIGSTKTLAELRELGLIGGDTRLYAVQGTGCAPIVRAHAAGETYAEPWRNASTEAWGLRVPGALGDFLMLEAIRESGGGGVAVSDEAMKDGALELGGAGVGAAIEGGATLAGARELRRSGELRDGETVVLFNTGNLLTY
ncbi:threonine synthase [Candidatus Palauibacter soopunensis]|uniref:threonine synthase n=1 Tax=Candidatus Palauibacter soopunensis TaxID=3056739 RepID=UPI0023877094|nr:threonine synthase [Candidatus Palauibacter soopunensis]MDE2880154.1 threonine synthase [Candidatus Palauibacter soopunensis]